MPTNKPENSFKENFIQGIVEIDKAVSEKIVEISYSTMKKMERIIESIPFIGKLVQDIQKDEEKSQCGDYDNKLQ